MNIVSNVILDAVQLKALQMQGNGSISTLVSLAIMNNLEDLHAVSHW